MESLAKSICVVALTTHTARNGSEHMSDGVKEEELGRNGGLDKHDNAGRDDCQESDDVHHTDAVEDDVAGPGQRFR